MKDDFNIFILCYYNVFIHAVIIYKLFQVVTNVFNNHTLWCSS
ncbi:putative membrane protein [Bacteroides fragilis str. 1007-1-F |uniref:Membrane protein n=2 Tax=Bacteroides fragilis TaxID=817 RepID=A0AAN4MZR0_BACFG|nr:putative membrane protein [Bacteroides fragilis str. 1007-1-F \